MMFESNADLAVYVRQQSAALYEAEKYEAVGIALAKACCFQFIYLFILGVIVLRFLNCPWDTAGVISFVFAFVGFTPYFAFLVKIGRIEDDK